jgi:diguanylate cyclase (GGDEF)-like protein
VIESYAAQAAVALSNAHLVERLEKLASQDPLTGLLNHREFHEAVERELGRADRYGSRFSVLLLDLDSFKQVNDRHGHAVGDDVLREAAARLGGVFRTSDLVCRIGGDEFGVILPETGAAEASSMGQRAQAAVDGLGKEVSVSVGVAEWPEDGPTKDLMLIRADSDLYEAKRNLKRSVTKQADRPSLRSSEVGPT